MTKNHIWRLGSSMRITWSETMFCLKFAWDLNVYAIVHVSESYQSWYRFFFQERLPLQLEKDQVWFLYFIFCILATVKFLLISWDGLFRFADVVMGDWGRLSNVKMTELCSKLVFAVLTSAAPGPQTLIRELWTCVELNAMVHFCLVQNAMVHFLSCARQLSICIFITPF